ncbi:MAG: hypothetical protein HZB20_10730 [Chloroflexi bacterium]|nr:hypothetical protein [Chloroflexota bacterium]
MLQDEKRRAKDDGFIFRRWSFVVYTNKNGGPDPAAAILNFPRFDKKGQALRPPLKTRAKL